MKKISLPTELLVALAQLEDKDVALVVRAIISYANEGIAPSFSNAALKAFFSLFRSIIDDQRAVSEKLSVINRDNAKGKKSSAKKKDAKSSSSSSKALVDADVATAESKSEQIVAPTTDSQNNVASTSDSQPIATAVSEPLTLEAIEAVYPRLGSFRSESLSIWSQFSEETRKRAIEFVPTYISQHPLASDQLYLNQYLKAEPWNK